MLYPSFCAGQSDLWAKLEALDLDGGAQLSFSKRLARDNGWTASFAQRVVIEYKKFVFMAATSAHPVTPSDEVDQAWHLHLVYTRSYWDELCGQVLGFPLHHGPTKGGAAEGHKFQGWYGQTLQTYHAVFGVIPPADIWPSAAVRFGEAPYFRRVNVRRHLVLRWPCWPRMAMGVRGWVALAGGVVLAGCTARLPPNPFNWYGTEFLSLFWVLMLTLLPLSVWLARRGRGTEEVLTGLAPLGTYELARLAGRGQLVADSALAALAHSGKIELLAGQKVTRMATTPPEVPYERALWNLIVPAGWSSLALVRGQAQSPTVGALRMLDKTLEMNGLLLTPSQRRQLNLYPLLTTLALGVFGFTKVLVGLSRGRPVGLLLLSLLVLFMAGVCCRYYGPWATGRGVRLLRELAPTVRLERRTMPLSARIVALSVALFGVSELSALGLGRMAELLGPPPSTSGGDGGSGCGGDGGGSGCGGCGGCGGD